MNQSPPPQIIARDLRRSFKLGTRTIEVLRGISVEIRAGEAVFLCGASGAGKTTLLYTLAGLERPEAGEVIFEGQKLYDGAEARQARIRNERVGFVFQGYFLLPELTALENVLLPSMIGGGKSPKPKAQSPKSGDPARERESENSQLSTHNSQQRAEAALRLVGLSERLHHLPPELSGGEQQRVAIARAIINEPSVIFADEPTGNLDSKTGEGIMQLLLSLVRERGMTLVVVTHDAALATRGDRRLEIHDGRLV